MTDHAMNWAPRVLRGVLAVVLGAAAATGGVLLAIASFSWTSWAPALISLAMIVGGGVLYRRTDDVLARGLALGLILGAFVTVLLWPWLRADSGTLESLRGGF
jgi:peptidoglycan biosynthesis protein MviN/MurJ (putative lipid II flippase)